jgi:hypothetical protein
MLLLTKDHAIALFAQRAHRLRPRVVELRRLPDHDGPAAEDEDALEVGPLGHRPSCACARLACVRPRARAPARPTRGWAGAGVRHA